MIADTTEPQNGEAELRVIEDQFRSVFENSNDAILLSTNDGIIEAANPEACRLFGRAEGELRQIKWAALVDPTDTCSEVLKQQAQAGRCKGELKLRRKDGSVFLGEVCSAFFKDRFGSVKTSVIIRDISERKPIEETLRHITEGNGRQHGR